MLMSFIFLLHLQALVKLELTATAVTSETKPAATASK